METINCTHQNLHPTYLKDGLIRHICHDCDDETLNLKSPTKFHPDYFKGEICKTDEHDLIATKIKLENKYAHYCEKCTYSEYIDDRLDSKLHRTCCCKQDWGRCVFRYDTVPYQYKRHCLHCKKSRCFANEFDPIPPKTVPTCEKCNDIKWVWKGTICIVGFSRILFSHVCLCGHPDVVRLHDIHTEKVMNTDNILMYMRKDYEGPDFNVEDDLKAMSLTENSCDYPDCDETIRILCNKRSKNNKFYFINYFLEGSFRITHTPHDTFQRLDFCEKHKSHGEIYEENIIVFDPKDESYIDSDHIRKYEHEQRGIMNSSESESGKMDLVSNAERKLPEIKHCSMCSDEPCWCHNMDHHNIDGNPDKCVDCNPKCSECSERAEVCFH